jgi:signal transduction histidine kinase
MTEAQPMNEPPVHPEPGPKTPPRPAPSTDTTVERVSRWGRELPLLASLRVRLCLLVLAGVVPFLGLVLYTALEERYHAIEAARQNALQMVRVAGDRQDELLEGARQLLATLALLQEVQDHNRPACEQIFTNLLTLHPGYANIGAIRPDGEVFASAFPTEGEVNLGDRLYFQLAVETRQFAIGDCQIGKITKKATLNVGYPALSSTGALRAVVYAALDLTWLKSMLTNSTLPQGSSLTVVDRNRVTLVRHPDPRNEYVGQVLPSGGGMMNRRPRRFDTNAPPVPGEWMRWRQATGLRTNESSGFGRGRDGVERLYATTRLGHTGEANAIRVTVGIPVSEAYAPANRTLRRNLLVVALVTIAAMAIAWYGGGLLVLRRIKALLRATDRISSGDYTARVGGLPGTGELHLLAQSFDEMATALQRRVQEREKAEAALLALNQRLEQRVAERTAQLERSNRDLEQFAYVASHDLQEPLRVVTKYVTLLRDRYQGQLEPKAGEFVSFALEGSARMQDLIMALLAYSRVDSQGQPFGRTDCNQVLERARLNLRVALDESRAVVTSDPLPTLLADEVQLGQLFQNLLSNALKFRGEQPPQIHLGARQEGNAWHFTVRDNGIGIPAESLPRAFVLFQRFHSRNKYPGTGIGLSICKKIVERHGGHIWVESQVNAGTTFHFTLAAAAPGTGPATN